MHLRKKHWNLHMVCHFHSWHWQWIGHLELWRRELEAKWVWSSHLAKLEGRENYLLVMLAWPGNCCWDHTSWMACETFSEQKTSSLPMNEMLLCGLSLLSYHYWCVPPIWGLLRFLDLVLWSLNCLYPATQCPQLGKGVLTQQTGYMELWICSKHS